MVSFKDVVRRVMKRFQSTKKKRPWTRKRSSSAPVRPRQSETQGISASTTLNSPRESAQSVRILPRTQKSGGPVASMNTTTTIIAASKSSPSLVRTSTESLPGLNLSSLSSISSEINPTTTSTSSSSSSFTSATTSSTSIDYTSSSRRLSAGPSRPKKAGQEITQVSPSRRSRRRHRKRYDAAGFDPELFLSYLNETLADPELDLEAFLNIFRSVTTLFNSLGPVFTFVVGEMDEKLRVLDQLRTSEAKEHYRTVEGMVRYERKARLIEGNSNSGVRMQQRLHRALPFIAELLTKMDTVGPQEYLYPFVRDVYMRTLSNHHSWVIRKTIMFALRALPRRSEFEAVIMGSEPKNLEKWRELSSQLEQAINKIYDTSEKIYAKYKVPQLP